MKHAKQEKHTPDQEGNLRLLLAKAAAAEKQAQLTKANLKSLKKAFKQAKQEAKRAKKQAKGAHNAWEAAQRKTAKTKPKPKKPAMRSGKVAKKEPAKTTSKAADVLRTKRSSPTRPRGAHIRAGVVTPQPPPRESLPRPAAPELSADTAGSTSGTTSSA